MKRWKPETIRWGCLWCGDTNGVLSEEHIVAQWVSRRFHTRYARRIVSSPQVRVKVPLESGRFYDSDNPATSPTKKLQWTVPVCKTCNNGWMSSLENAASPIVTSMIWGTPTTIDGGAQTTVAVWAAKTLVNSGFAILKRPDHYYPIALREHLRTHKTPPDDLRIVATPVSGVGPVVIPRVTPFTLQRPGGRHRGNGAVTTVLIDQAAFQMTNAIPAELSQPHPLVKAGAAVQLWPPLGAPVSWPPPGAVAARDLDAFLEPDQGAVFGP